jgi:hypothetical protein
LQDVFFKKISKELEDWRTAWNTHSFSSKRYKGQFNKPELIFKYENIKRRDQNEENEVARYTVEDIVQLYGKNSLLEEKENPFAEFLTKRENNIKMLALEKHEFGCKYSDNVREYLFCMQVYEWLLEKRGYDTWDFFMKHKVTVSNRLSLATLVLTGIEYDETHQEELEDDMKQFGLLTDSEDEPTQQLRSGRISRPPSEWWIGSQQQHNNSDADSNGDIDSNDSSNNEND